MNDTKYLVGLVSPEILEVAESQTVHPVHLDLNACTALEIRYDFFEESAWKELSERVKNVAPGKLQIGTIRLKRDGGTFPDAKEIQRLDLWEKILEAGEVPQWLDLERDCLHNYESLDKLTAARKVKILISEHNFARVPSESELEQFAKDVKRFNAPGLKLAAMSCTTGDCSRLYKFIRKHSKKFQLFSAFGMGDIGKTSRLWSLKEGANLTYGTLGKVHAPGQIDISTMALAVEQLENMQNEDELFAFLTRYLP
ncbi:MAG: type I 3-dehydroquinate dehydratase [Fibrobacter sp.]|nr:type I 3-dehydroquinate dehydratase [Fibrobacter sp.]